FFSFCDSFGSARASSRRFRWRSWSPATNSVQYAIETHFQRLLHGNLNSPKSDARTHRTPKALRAKSVEAPSSFCDSFGSARASSRRFCWRGWSPATNSVQCAIETHFQRLLPANLNSPKSDARTHRTPKHFVRNQRKVLFVSR